MGSLRHQFVRFGFECKIYMGAEDMRRQALNVLSAKWSRSTWSGSRK